MPCGQLAAVAPDGNQQSVLSSPDSRYQARLSHKSTAATGPAFRGSKSLSSSSRRAENASDQMAGGAELVASDLCDSLRRKQH